MLVIGLNSALVSNLNCRRDFQGNLLESILEVASLPGKFNPFL